MISRLRRHLAFALITVPLIACAGDGSGLSSQQAPLKASGPRTIAIGDVHGDFDRFVQVLESAKLINNKRKWIGGGDTLVQVGDLTDRGPDSRKAIDLLRKLKKQAKRKGGRVEIVIGNHEVMNVTGDLRYVHPGEYKAFKDKRSKARLESYYAQTLKALKAAVPEGEEFVLENDHRANWNKQFPLGYVAHRLAWDPSGEYGRWVLSNSAAVKVDRAVFVHGGISSKYSEMPLSQLNTRIRTEIADPSKWQAGSIIDDPNGPFWYRGWARLPETAENEAALDQVLANLNVDRMVIAHTPLINTVLPRFGGKVLMVDIGMSAHYGGANAALELSNGKAFVLLAGQRIELPTTKQGVLDYLAQAATLVDNDKKILSYREQLLAQYAEPANDGVFDSDRSVEELKQAAQ